MSVNGRAVTKPGATVGSADVVYFDGRPVEPEPLEYYLLNKAAGVVSSVSDPQGRPTITSQVKSRARLFPVGRLDQATTGLIILTNDGALAHRLMHPHFEVDKVYVAEVEGTVREPELEKLRQGLELEDGPTAPAGARLAGRHAGGSIVEMIIHQGRKRQVRRMLAAAGHPVIRLHRKRYAMLTDEGLATGQSRRLSEEEVEALQKLVMTEKP